MASPSTALIATLALIPAISMFHASIALAGFAAAALCFIAFRATRSLGWKQGREAACVWSLLSIVLGLIAVERLFPVRDWFMRFAASLIESPTKPGSLSHEIAAAWIAIAVVVAASCIISMFWITRDAWRLYRLPLLSALCVIVFAISRIAFPAMLEPILWLSAAMNLLELASLVVIAVEAVRHARPITPPPVVTVCSDAVAFNWLVKSLDREPAANE